MTTVEKIICLLKQKGAEQKDLAEFIGVSNQAVTDWKSGRTHSYKRYIDKIADYFGVSVDCLLNDAPLPDCTGNDFSNSINVAYGENSSVVGNHTVSYPCDDMLEEFIERFKKLNFSDRVKVMNYTIELDSKKTE